MGGPGGGREKERERERESKRKKCTEINGNGGKKWGEREREKEQKREREREGRSVSQKERYSDGNYRPWRSMFLIWQEGLLCPLKRFCVPICIPFLFSCYPPSPFLLALFPFPSYIFTNKVGGDQCGPGHCAREGTY